MKKFLSLVLALVMTASLVTVSAGAKEFKDDKDVTYDEAVAVISEVGVVDGDTEGNFRPTDNLSRGAAAKIICNLILGPTTAAELKADTAPYKDVPVSNVFSGYIAYCAKEGIISGYADGSFRPAGTLTGYAFMKMLLGALGYDSTYEGYTGANWSINVAKQAIGIGLNKGLTDEFNGVDFVTREEAALYAFNTLKATMVDYEQKITTNVNGVDVTISQGSAKPVTWTEGKNNDGNIKDDKFVQFAEEFFPKLVRDDDYTKFMEPANVWTYDKTEIGTYERIDLLVEKYTAGVTGRDVYDLLKAGVIKDNDFESYLDGAKGGVKIEDISRANEKNLADTGNGVVTKVYLNTDKKLITVVSINTWLAQATGDYSESKEYAPVKVFTGKDETASYNVDVEDVANVVDVKNDTFYQVNISYKNGTRGEVVVVAPVEVLEDSTVTKFSAEKGSVTKLTTGGEEYKNNVKAFYDKDVLHEYDQSLLTDNTYNVFVDTNGYFLGVELFEGTKNYVFITGYDRPTSNLSVKTADAAAIFLDGTMEQIKVNVKDTNSNIDDLKNDEGTKAYFTKWSDDNGGEYAHNRWYTYTKTEAGVYTLKPCARMTATDYTVDTTLNTANLRVSDNVKNSGKANVYGEDATVFLTVDLDEVDTTLDKLTTKRAITEVTGVYTGVQEVDLEIDPGTAIEEAEVYTVYDSDYFIVGAVVVGEGKGNAANIAYILDGAKSEEYKDGTYYWEFECIMDGTVQTLTAKSKYVETIRALRSDKDGIVELRFDGEYVVNVKDVTDIYNEKHYTDSDTTGKPNVDISKFDVYDVSKANELSLQGRTLYVLNNQADNGLALAKDAKAVVIQDENNKENVKTEFTSVEAAKNYLADANPKKAGLQYKGRIIAALDNTGAATWVLFDSDTKLTTGSEQSGGNAGSDKYFEYDSVPYASGYAVMDYTVKRPAWLDKSDTDALKFSFNVAVNGVLYANVTNEIAKNDTEKKDTWNNGGMLYIKPVKVGDKITIEDFKWTNLDEQTYIIKYVNEHNEDLAVGVMENLGTDSDKTIRADVAQVLKHKVASGAFGGGEYDWSIEGVEAAATGAKLSGTDANIGSSQTTVANVKVKADLEDFVKVIIDTQELIGNYTVTGDSTGKALNVWVPSYTGWGDTKTAKINVVADGAGNSSSNAQTVAEGGKVDVHVELDSAIPATVGYGLKLTLSTGDDVIFANDGTTTISTKIDVDAVRADETITIVGVEAVAVPTVTCTVQDKDGNNKLTVGDTVTVSFSENVTIKTAEPVVGGAGITATETVNVNDAVSEIVYTITGVGTADMTLQLVAGNLVNAAGLQVLGVTYTINYLTNAVTITG